MKDLIIMIGTALLGVFIYQLMVGDGPEGMQSLKSASESVFAGAVLQFGGQ